MGMARDDICEQTKCFPGMKKTDAKFDIKSDIKTCRSIIFHSTLEQKHAVLWNPLSQKFL